jgi:tetratricopeptide (TPR) repeat protein
MSDHFFISYSTVDGRDFALRLADELFAGPPPFAVWVDQRRMRPAEDWDDQIVEAIKTCKGMIFVMTMDSVRPTSFCKAEWTRALRYKKPIIPLLLNRDAESPLPLGSRQYIDFTPSFESALAKLRKHLAWMDSPNGLLQALKYRLADAERELARAEQEQQERIREDIAELEVQVAHLQTTIDDPEAAEERVQESIERGLQLVRLVERPPHRLPKERFVNQPPLVAPTWFQDRHVETRLIGEFLRDDALRLMTVVGRGGIGKSAMVCRLLRSLECGHLPDDGGPLAVDGIVYLSNARALHRVTVPDLFASLGRLLPEETERRLHHVYRDRETVTRDAMQALLGAFPQGRIIVLLDNFEDAVNMETRSIIDAELGEALRSLLELPPHGLKVIVTTRIAPADLALVEPGRQRRLDLDAGLEHPFAENILRKMDVDGKVGLRDAPETQLAEARERTCGYPRALEHLFGILSADRSTSLQEILDDTKQLLPERVTEVLVGEAFSRLDVTAQRVLQAIATYRYAVPAAAVDYLLQPYMPGIDSAAIIRRLVNMQFIRNDAGRYYLHQIDRDYALGRIPKGEPTDRTAQIAPFTRFALLNRAADWFMQARKAKEAWRTLDDVAAQLSEFELRCAGEDYDGAAIRIREIDFGTLILWGHYGLVKALHERLQGRIADPAQARRSAGMLGTSNFWMGQFQQAIDWYERALGMGRESGNRHSESVWLSNLGVCYGQVGEIDKAIDCLKQSLAVVCEFGDRNGEASVLAALGSRCADVGKTDEAIDYCNRALAIARSNANRASEAVYLCNLGSCYSNLGQVELALRCVQEALTIALEIGYRLVECSARVCMGNAFLDQEKWDEAIRQFKCVVEIADETGNTRYQLRARLSLAVAYLLITELKEARAMAEAACQFNHPRLNLRASGTLGVIALRQGDRVVAEEALTAALKQSFKLLAVTPNLCDALNMKALALCGLALCGSPQERIREAQNAYQAARTVNSDDGIVSRNLRLFDALAQADMGGILADVRIVASGGRSS